MRYFVLIFATVLIPFLSHSQTNRGAIAVNHFAFDLDKLNSKMAGNIFFSPLSVEVALAMTSAGARTETLNQMLRTLHLGSNDHSEFCSLLAQMKSGSNFELLIANQIWGQSGVGYLPAFIKLLGENYGAKLTPLDFRKQPENSRKIINKWVAQQTKNKIQDLLRPGIITADTDLVLTNAIYFNGTWAQQFRKELTQEDSFFITEQEKKPVPFMHLRSNLAYSENSNSQLLEIPYKGNELVMDILLPKPGVDVRVIENNLNAKTFNELVQQNGKTQVDVSLPKFRAESTFELGSDLQSLGMLLAFDPERADFRGLFFLWAGIPNLRNGKKIHLLRCQASSFTPTCLKHAYVADEAFRLAFEPFCPAFKVVFY